MDILKRGKVTLHWCKRRIDEAGHQADSRDNTITMECEGVLL